MTHATNVANALGNMLDLVIDPGDGGDPIEVRIPTIKWMHRSKIRKVNKMVNEAGARADEVAAWERSRAVWAEKRDEWVVAGSKGKAPVEPPADPPYDLDEDFIPSSIHQIPLFYLREFCTDEDFRRIWDVSDGTAIDIFNRLNGVTSDDDGDEGEGIGEGESEASADS